MPNCRISCAPLAFLQGNYNHPPPNLLLCLILITVLFLAHKTRKEHKIPHCLSVLLSFFRYGFRTDLKIMIQNYSSRSTFLIFNQRVLKETYYFYIFCQWVIKSTYTLNNFHQYKLNFLALRNAHKCNRSAMIVITQVLSMITIPRISRQKSPVSDTPQRN